MSRGPVVGAAARPPTVADALSAAQRAGMAPIDAQWLLAHQLTRSRTWLAAHRDSPLESTLWTRWDGLLQRHRAGEPLAYLMGEQDFRGLTLAVGPAVLVPRPDTEVLVDWAIELLDQRGDAAPADVVDLGCGSGAIALALKSARPSARVVATDRSAEALQVAGANGARLGLAVDWRAGDWWGAVAGARFDLALSNPPYIAEDDPHLADLRHEPWQALVAADEGLAALRAIIDGAPGHLRRSGWLLLEHGHQQAPAVAGLLRARGFEAVQTRHDRGGRPRCTGGRWQLPTG